MAASCGVNRANMDGATANPTPREEDDYIRGNIVKIELCNFMSYDHVVCCPGPRLNLVIEPNGSGLSSLVCAIALGLAGNPKIVGRASNLGAFVKSEEDSGHVKISLCGDTPSDKICITRKIDKQNTSDQWLLNGATVSKQEVIDVVKSFNIQVENLTQFLPQDRSEFAKLSPIHLLEETEKAVAISKELKALEMAIKQKEQTLNSLKALNAELEKDVECIGLRNKLLRKAELMKKKLPWLKYDMLKKEFIEVIQDQEKTVRKKMKEAEICLESSKNSIEYVPWKSQLEITYDEIEDLKSREERILKAKEDLAAVEKDLEDLQPYEHGAALEQLSGQIVDISLDIKCLKEDKRAKDSQLAEEKEIMDQNRLQNMESKNSKQLEALRCYTFCDRIAEAYHWVRENKMKFRKEVYGPVLLEVNVHDMIYANYLENHVSSYIWKSFITQDASDHDELARQMKQYEVPVLNYNMDKDIKREPLNITQDMQQLGIFSRLDQIFEAPSAVKDVLIMNSDLDSSYIGTQETDRKAYDLPKLGIFDCWTPQNHYRWSKSRYGDHISACVDVVASCRLFMSHIDDSDTESLHAENEKHLKNIQVMEEELLILQRKHRQLEDQEARIHMQKEEIINMGKTEKKNREEIRRRADIKRRKLDCIYKEDDVESSRTELVDEVTKLNGQRFTVVTRLKELLMEAVGLKHSYAEDNMAYIELDEKVREMEKGVKKLQKDAILAAREYRACKIITGRYTQQLHVAKQLAESTTMITDELAKDFITIPTTIDELEASVQDIEWKTSHMLFLNQNVVEEYQSRQHETIYSNRQCTKSAYVVLSYSLAISFADIIESISKNIQDDKERYELYSSEIETVKGKWLPILSTLVSKINDKFSRGFQDMAAVGEVSLGVDPINERKIFQKLVRAASQLNTQQCFLVTPKLLPDLEYSDDACTVLQIMNGPWMEKAAKVTNIIFYMVTSVPA
ncbi:hypothetical protein EJB05_29085, partial [Eragrostis curvula]